MKNSSALFANLKKSASTFKSPIFLKLSTFPKFFAFPSFFNPSVSAFFLVLKYFKNDLWWIFRTIPYMWTLIAALPYKDPQERSLKIMFLSVNRNKTYIKYYNFYSWYKNCYPMTEIKRPNRIPYILLFLRDQAFSCQ